MRHCYPKPIGCGREISEEEFASWDLLSQKEFRISGICLDPCQNEYFAEEDEDEEEWDYLDDRDPEDPDF